MTQPCLGIRLAIMIAGIVWGTTVAVAGDYTIVERGKSLSHKRITVRVGESITFVNRDAYTHNLYSATKGHEFDFGARAPGKTDTIKFDTLGRIIVRCAIHPKIKLEIIVTP